MIEIIIILHKLCHYMIFIQLQEKKWLGFIKIQILLIHLLMIILYSWVMDF